MKIAIGSDHGGFQLKQSIIKYFDSHQILFKDIGCYTEESVDYPDYAVKVARLITQENYDIGIMIDGAGVGSCMAANKISGIRAATCNDLYTAGNAREHNNANMLLLGSMVVGSGKVIQIVEKFISTSFAGGRHERRVNKIMALEDQSSNTLFPQDSILEVVNQVVESVLRNAPATVVDSSISNTNSSAPRLITEDWVKAQYQKGIREITVSSSNLITPLAKDFAREKQIKFIE